MKFVLRVSVCRVSSGNVQRGEKFRAMFRPRVVGRSSFVYIGERLIWKFRFCLIYDFFDICREVEHFIAAKFCLQLPIRSAVMPLRNFSMTLMC